MKKYLNKLAFKNKFAVIGITKAGKSTLLNKFTGMRMMIFKTGLIRETSFMWVLKYHTGNDLILTVKYKNHKLEDKSYNFTFASVDELVEKCTEYKRNPSVTKFVL